jgi:hypothetical protein
MGAWPGLDDPKAPAFCRLHRPAANGSTPQRCRAQIGGVLRAGARAAAMPGATGRLNAPVPSGHDDRPRQPTGRLAVAGDAEAFRRPQAA